jgi:hypothetical protein
MHDCLATWLHGYTETRIHRYTDTQIHGYTDARIHGCMDAWMHGYMYDVRYMYDVGCKADPAFLVMAINIYIYVHGCTYAWLLAISSYSKRNPTHAVGAKVPSSFRWQRIAYQTPVFCNRHCLNVCEQIRKTQAEPQWIVAQRLLSALTIQYLDSCKSSAKRFITSEFRNYD